MMMMKKKPSSGKLKNKNGTITTHAEFPHVANFGGNCVAVVLGGCWPYRDKCVSSCVCVSVCLTVCGPDLSRDPGCWKAKVSLSLQLTPLCCRLSVCVRLCVGFVQAHVLFSPFVCVCMCAYLHALLLSMCASPSVIEGEVSVSVDVLQTPPASPWQLPVARSRPGYAGSYHWVKYTTSDPTDTSPLYTHSNTHGRPLGSSTFGHNGL